MADDTTRITVRRVAPRDSAGLQEFYAGLSPESRYARFLGFTRGLSDSGARTMCCLDHHSDEGFVAIAHADGREIVVGHLCVDRTGPGEAELGVAIDDEWQGRRIGRRLFEHALRWAQSNGYREIVATALAENWRVLRLLSSAPFGARVTSAPGGIVEVVIPLGTSRRVPAAGLSTAA